MPAESEQRKDTRVPIASKIDYRGENDCKGVLIDLSPHGAGFICQEEIEPGTPLELVLARHTLLVTGAVRNTRKLGKGKYRVGMAFEFDQKDLVDALLDSGHGFDE